MLVLVDHSYPLSSHKEKISDWEAQLARTIPQSGAHNAGLQPEDFVVSVSFNQITLNLIQSIHS